MNNYDEPQTQNDDKTDEVLKSQPIEVKVSHPEGKFDLSIELPIGSSKIDQAAWRKTLDKVADLLCNPTNFLHPRDSVAEVNPELDPDGWINALVGILLPDAKKFFQRGIPKPVRDKIVKQIQKLAETGGNLTLDFGSLPLNRASQTPETAGLDLTDWLVLEHLTALKSQLTPFTSPQSPGQNQIQIGANLTIADWAEAPLASLNPQNQPSAAAWTSQASEFLSQSLTTEKTNQACDFQVSTQTAWLERNHLLDQAETASEQLLPQLMAIWTQSETVFEQALIKINQSLPENQSPFTNWQEYYLSLKTRQAGPRSDIAVDNTLNYREMVQAILETQPEFLALINITPGFEIFGGMTPVWKEAFLNQILQANHQNTSTSHKELLQQPELIKLTLTHLSRKIVFNQLKSANLDNSLRFDWNRLLEDQGVGPTNEVKPILALRVMGAASALDLDPASDKAVFINREPVLNAPELKLVEIASIVAGGEKIAVADAQTLANKLAQLIYKLRNTPLVVTRNSSMDKSKNLGQVMAKLKPKNSTTTIQIQLAIQ